ncbi:MAG: hypothetical protein GY801_19185 [bacterium]|nr:hypothetical protein [bacterium]
MALHPVHQSGQSLSLMYNHALGICSQSNNKLYAAKLIDALTDDPEISNYYFSRVGHLPSNAQHLNDSLYSSPFYDAYRAQLQNAVCINGQHEMFDRAVIFCLDAADNILFHGADIEDELEEKNHYLSMLYKNLPGFLMPS